MTSVMPTPHQHTHQAVVVHVLRRREGVPYEVEQKVCTACEETLAEKTVRRAAAA